jgi:predicted DNA-binding transcriptional regulator AlpA
MKELWDTQAAARALHLHPATIRKYARRSDFPKGIMLNGGHVWEAERVRAWYRREVKRRRKARAF